MSGLELVSTIIISQSSTPPTPLPSPEDKSAMLITHRAMCRLDWQPAIQGFLPTLIKTEHGEVREMVTSFAGPLKAQDKSL